MLSFSGFKMSYRSVDFGSCIGHDLKVWLYFPFFNLGPVCLKTLVYPLLVIDVAFLFSTTLYIIICYQIKCSAKINMTYSLVMSLQCTTLDHINTFFMYLLIY